MKWRAPVQSNPSVVTGCAENQLPFQAVVVNRNRIQLGRYTADLSSGEIRRQLAQFVEVEIRHASLRRVLSRQRTTVQAARLVAGHSSA